MHCTKALPRRGTSTRPGVKVMVPSLFSFKHQRQELSNQRTLRSVAGTGFLWISLVKPGPRRCWFNRKQMPSEANKVWPVCLEKGDIFQQIYLAKADGGSGSAATCGVSCLLSGGSQPSCCPCCFFFFPFLLSWRNADVCSFLKLRV